MRKHDNIEIIPSPVLCRKQEILAPHRLTSGALLPEPGNTGTVSLSGLPGEIGLHRNGGNCMLLRQRGARQTPRVCCIYSVLPMFLLRKRRRMSPS